MNIRKCPVCGTEFDATTPGRYRTSCSPECTQKRRVQNTLAARKVAAAKTKCPRDKHGTSTGYTYHLCRCAKCRKWSAEYQAQRRNKVSQNGTPNNQKGT